MDFDDRFGGLSNSPKPPRGQLELRQLKEGGFGPDELAAHKQQTTEMLQQGGFLAKDIDAYWGDNQLSTEKFAELVRRNLERVPQKDRQTVANDPVSLFAAGWNNGNIGLMIGGKPTKFLPEDAGTYEKVLYGAGQLAGDFPAMVVGGTIGAFGGGAVGTAAAPGPGTVAGGVVGAGAGAAALPTAIREALLFYYDRGEISTWREFMNRVGSSTLEIGKQTLIGGATAPLGVVGGKVVGGTVGQTVDRFALTGVAGVTNVTTQAVTAAALQGALDGHVPDASDFMSGAILALATHGASRIYARTRAESAEAPLNTDRIDKGIDPEAAARTSYNMRRLYAETGILPWEANEMIKNDPILRQELFQQDASGNPNFEKFRTLAKPDVPYGEPTPAKAVEETFRQAEIAKSQELLRDEDTRIDWDRWAKNPKEIVTRIDDTKGDKRLYADPTAIADYLQEFGRRAGFRFLVGGEEQYPVGDPRRPKGQAGPHNRTEWMELQRRDGTRERVGTADAVYMPDTSDAMYRAWYGLGRSEILYHEVGHALDTMIFNKDNNTTKQISPELYTELTEVSRRFRPKLWSIAPDHNRKNLELMADAIAVWLSNPAERKHMPLFAAQYAERLEPYKKIVERTLPKLREDGGWETPEGEPIKDNWYPIKDPEPPEGGQGEGPPKPPVPPGVRMPPPEKPKRIEGSVLTLTADEVLEKWRDKIGVPNEGPSIWNLSRMYREFVSELGPARNMDKLLKEKGYDTDVKMGLEDMFRQTYASSARAGYFTRYGILDAITLDQKSPASFMSAQKLIGKGGNTQDWIGYMLARRTLDKAAQGIETGFDVMEAGQVVKEKDKLYRAATDEFNKVNRGVLEYGRDSGLFSQEQTDAMTDANPAYITFRRIIGDRTQPFTGGRGFRVKTPLRRMEGDDGRIIDPLLATIDNTALIVRMADRNRAIGSVIELAERHGIEPLLGLKKLPPPEVKATIAEPGSEIFKPYEVANTRGEYDPFLAQRAVRGGKLRDNQFIYLRNGKAEIWEAANEDFARLMRGADNPNEVNAILKIIEGPARLQRAGIVADPVFPAKTGLRDQVTSFLADPTSPPPFLTMLRGVVPVLTENARYKDWIAKGGAGAALAALDADYLARDMHSMMETTGTWEKMYNVVRHPIEAAQIINEKMDAMARIGSMIHSEKIGFEPLKAATQGRKAYIDFVEKGTADIINKWAKWVPFMRPNILGLKQLGEAVKNDPLATSAKIGLAVAVPTMLLYALNYLQDEYGDLPENRKFRNLSRWSKDTMFILPEIGGTRLKLPNPPIVGPMVGGFITRTLDHFVAEDKTAFKDWATGVLTSFLPPFVPTIATPFIESFADRDLYTYNKLIPASLERDSGYMQYTENTTEVAKALSRVLSPQVGVFAPKAGADFSPIMVDNWVQSWTGTVGMAAMRALSAPFNSNGRPWEVADIPFVQSFVLRNPRGGAQPIKDFFDEKRELDKTLADRRTALQRAGVGADNRDEVTASLETMTTRLDGISKTLRIQNNIVLAINNNKEMTTDEKRQNIDSAYSAMIQTARIGLEIARAVKGATAQATGP